MSPEPVAPQEYVVDASAGIKLIIEEAHSDRARDLFGLLAQDPPCRLHVPELFYFECANVLWKHARRGGTSVEQALHGISDLLALPLVVHPSAGIVGRALEVGAAHDITAYDASYVVLTQMLGLSLVTADERLARKLAGAPVAVSWLGTWTVGGA